MVRNLVSQRQNPTRRHPCIFLINPAGIVNLINVCIQKFEMIIILVGFRISILALKEINLFFLFHPENHYKHVNFLSYRYYYSNQLINILKEAHLSSNYYNLMAKAPMTRFKYILQKEMYHKT